MSRNVIGVVMAFALLVGGAMLSTESAAIAGHGCGGCGGGLFAKLKASRGCGGQVAHCGGHVKKQCGGGLFAKLRARRAAACCAPEPTCCAPEPVCCTPEPACCTPEPVCCTPEPVCCTPEPTCCAAPAPGCCTVEGEVEHHEEHAAEEEAIESPGDGAAVPEAPPVPTEE